MRLPTSKWWERLPDELKVLILNAGFGWHDLYEPQVLAVRAAAKLYHQPGKLRAWLSKAPQDHQVTLSKLKILDLLLKKQKEFNAKGYLWNGNGSEAGNETGNVPFGSSGNAKSTIPLQMMDESGRTVDFSPVTLWAGPETRAIGWEVEDLEAERLLLSRDSIQDEIDDWINLHKIKVINPHQSPSNLMG